MIFDINIYPVKNLYGLNGEQTECAAAIICSSYPVDTERLACFRKLLILNFDDIIDINRDTAFHSDTAMQIRSFVDQLNAEATKLYICCDSGESRSTALAAAIMRYYHMDEMDIWNNPYYHPNPLVFRVQCEVFNCPVSKIGLQYRQWCSKRALWHAIRR